MGKIGLVSGHLRSHRNYWHVVLSLPQPGGGSKPKWISTGLKDQRGNKKKAEEILQERRREYTEKLRNRAQPGGNMLFGDFMIFWLSTIKDSVKLTTYNGYYNNIHNIIAPYFNSRGILLDDLAADDIEEFYSVQLQRVKPNTVRRYHANIHKALKFAAKSRNKPWYKPFIMAEVDAPKSNDFEACFLDEDKVIRLMEYLDGNELELAVLLGAYYGLRRGEVIGLRWSCIDFEKNSMIINHTVCDQTIDGQRQYIYQTPKSNRATEPTRSILS